MEFVHLQVQSSNSLLESPLTVKALVQAAKDRGYSAVALTDTNVMYGVVDFYRAAQEAGIKPLIGLTVVTQDATVVLIAETTAGYHRLLKLSTQLKTAAEPLNLEALDAFSDLAAILPAQALASGQWREHWPTVAALVQAIQTHQPKQVYLGLTAATLTPEWPALAKDLQLDVIALGDVAYQDPNDAFSQKVMQAIASGTVLNQRDATLMDPGTRWLTPPPTAAAPFVAAGQQQAVANALALAKRADVHIVFRNPQLPHFATPKQEPAADYLRTLATAGLAKRFQDATVPAAYQKRLTYELEVISEMGFADYFLVVWDVMNHAHEVGIMTGPGRGSAAGSLVSYALAITEVDPIAYDLLFERFLNPARANMPDIDLDIPDNRRGELIQYVHQRYGEDHMAQIITFGTFGAKQALRDVARVFGLSQFDSNKWSKAIPDGLHVTLEQAYQDSLPLRNLVADSEQGQALFATALKLEGLPRHDSTHAAGIVLAEEPLTNTVALQTGGDGIAQTQVPMGDVEALGLLKMDFLGLRNLGLLASITHQIEQTTKQPFDPKQIPLDDPETLALFARGDTNGVFQFESAGIKNALRTLRPTSFEDVVAMNALYRPGPMQNIDVFAARKNGQAPITYPAPALQPILEPTYGVLVYQEQVMQVASTMGGFTLGEADLLRRAMSKKKAAVLAKERARFLAGAKAKGYDAQTATTVYEYIDRFANYGFNRSHAVAYSMVAFWLAYLKVHYPAAFYAALMNSTLSNASKLKVYVQELKARHLTLLGPDINRSRRYFTLEDNALRFGLLTIKGVRRDFADALLAARTSGPFESLRDCLQRLDAKWLKVETLKPLVYAGAFDRFDENRAQTLANLDELISSVKLAGNDVGLFEVLQPKPLTVAEMPATERLEQEAAVLGVYLSGHPTDRYIKALAPYTPVTQAGALQAGQQVYLVLVIRHIKRIRTKKGQEMAFVDGQDATGDTSVTVFPNLYPQMRDWLEDQVVVVEGRVEDRDGLQVLANRLTTGEAALAALPDTQLFVQLPSAFEQEAALLKMFQDHAGATPVITVAQKTRQKTLLARRYWVAATPELVQNVKRMVGDANVVLRPVGIGQEG